jgi:hypothetical protein
MHSLHVNQWQGCIELLDRTGIEIASKTAVVIGRSNMVRAVQCSAVSCCQRFGNYQY